MHKPFGDELRTLLQERPSLLPEPERWVGPVHVAWLEVKPRVAHIITKGGTTQERLLAEWVTRQELEAAGYERYQLEPDEMARTASWTDIMAKAKRLISSGNVTLLRNGTNQVNAHVIGDHGEYNCEFSRDDPNSRALTLWNCECPWDQFSWGRTRQWKKFEGRPCAHVLAAYWKSLSAPLDDAPPGQSLDPGQKGPGPGGPMAPLPGAGMGPGGEPLGPSLTGEPLAVETGQVPPPQPPGMNPAMGMPGMGMGGMGMGMPGMMPTMTPGMMPPAGNQGVMMQNMMLNPPFLPGLGALPPSAMAPFMAPMANGIIPPFPMANNAENVMPVSVPGGRQPMPGNPVQWGHTFSSVDPSQDYQNGDVVRLEEELYGVAGGPVPGQYGDGQYQLVPKNSIGEALGTDPTTGWVDVIFPLNDSGPNEPFHARAWIEPEKLTLMNRSTPFVQKRSSAIPYYDTPLTPTGDAGGSTGAQFAQDPQGNQWLIKQYGGDQNRVANELLANSVYRTMGASAPQMGSYGGGGLAYPLMPGETAYFTDTDPEKQKALGQHFMTDALLANWDFAGLDDDNVLWNGNEPTRLDHGGTFEYRAQGEPKPYGPIPEEVWPSRGQLKRSPIVDEQAKQSQAAQISQTLTPEVIDQMVNEAPFTDEGMRERLRQNLKARVDWMGQYANGEQRLSRLAKFFPGESWPLEYFEDEDTGKNTAYQPTELEPGEWVETHEGSRGQVVDFDPEDGQYLIELHDGHEWHEGYNLDAVDGPKEHEPEYEAGDTVELSDGNIAEITRFDSSDNTYLVELLSGDREESQDWVNAEERGPMSIAIIGPGSQKDSKYQEGETVFLNDGTRAEVMRFMPNGSYRVRTEADPQGVWVGGDEEVAQADRYDNWIVGGQQERLFDPGPKEPLDRANVGNEEPEVNEPIPGQLKLTDPPPKYNVGDQVYHGYSGEPTTITDFRPPRQEGDPNTYKIGPDQWGNEDNLSTEFTPHETQKFWRGGPQAYYGGEPVKVYDFHPSIYGGAYTIDLPSGVSTHVDSHDLADDPGKPFLGQTYPVGSTVHFAHQPYRVKGFIPSKNEYVLQNADGTTSKVKEDYLRKDPSEKYDGQKYGPEDTVYKWGSSTPLSFQGYNPLSQRYHYLDPETGQVQEHHKADLTPAPYTDAGTCTHCHGKGKWFEECPTCYGTGSLPQTEGQVAQPDLFYKPDERVVCNDCHGTGVIEETCSYCKGTGNAWQAQQQAIPAGFSPEEGEITCPTCEGWGKKPDGTTCFECGGSGHVNSFFHHHPQIDKVDGDEEWHQNLDYDQAQAVKSYQDGSDVNRLLRGRYGYTHTADQVPHLDSAIDEHTSLQVPVTLFRGTRSDTLYDKFGPPATWKPGTIISDDGYTSTSVHPHTAHTFGNSVGTDKGVVFHINAPAGTPGMYVPDMGDYSESEWVLPRGAQMQIRRVGAPVDSEANMGYNYTPVWADLIGFDPSGGDRNMRGDQDE